MKFEPLYDHVLIRRSDPEAKSIGGIIIPDNAKEKPIEGEVLAIGVGKLLDGGTIRPLRVQVGDRVLFGRYAGTDTSIDGEKYVLILESEVLGIFRK